jgi:excisionase family DNA binding protein
MKKQETELLQRLDAIEALLKEDRTQPMNLETAAVYLSVSKSHLYKLTSTGQIAHFKPQGKLIYFLKSELDTWVMRNRVKPNTEVEELAIRYASTNHGGRK